MVTFGYVWVIISIFLLQKVSFSHGCVEKNCSVEAYSVHSGGKGKVFPGRPTYYAPHHEGVWVNGSIAPLFLNIGTQMVQILSQERNEIWQHFM